MKQYKRGLAKSRDYFFMGILPVLILTLLAVTKVEASTITSDENVQISKEVKPVEGMVNQWDINLTVEGKETLVPQDIMIVMDVSYSMDEKAEGVSRITKVKAAAKQFVEKILTPDMDNRVAIYTFSTGLVSTYSFSNNKTTVLNNIDKIALPYFVPNEGNTNIQVGLNEAKKYLQQQPLLRNELKISRSMVLFTDGGPNYSYMPADKNYLLPYVNGQELMDFVEAPTSNYNLIFETSENVPSFDYSQLLPIGADGTVPMPVEDIPLENIPPSIIEKYPDRVENVRRRYSHIKSTIAEANIIKKLKHPDDSQVNLVNNIYSVGIDLDSLTTSEKESAAKVIEKTATNGYSYYATSSGISAVLDEIAGNFLNVVYDAEVADPIAIGFEIEGTISNDNVSQGTIKNELDSNNQPRLTWHIGSLKGNNKTATLTYRVNANNAVLNNGLINAEGLAKTNGITMLNYLDNFGGKHALEFIVPQVRPIIVSLEKKLFDEAGKLVVDDSQKFPVVIGKDAYTQKDSFTLASNGEKVQIVHPWKAGTEYSVSENLATPEDYATSITINDKVTEGINANFSFATTEPEYVHQDVMITNKIIPKEMTVKLHVRQVVLNPNEELVIPSKAFIQGNLGENKVKDYHLIAGSTTKNTAEEITQALFTSYQVTLKDEYVLNLVDTIPEYYYFYGYIATTDANKIANEHVSTNVDLLKLDNLASLDYKENQEYWVTYFIQPKLGENEKFPRPYSWSYKTNEFGK